MKPVIFTLFLLLPASICRADIFLLKDGAKLEGEVTGELDGALLVKTQYGSLTINKADIVEQKPAPAAAPAAPAVLPVPAVEVQVSTVIAEVAVSTAAEIQAPALPPETPESAVPLTFYTVLPDTGTRLLVYAEYGVVIATETFDAEGAPVSLSGVIKNGTYSEYYPDGKLKTVKTVLGGKMSGSLKAYYPTGTLQVDAYYFDGAKEGDFKYFGESGELLMSAVYKNDRLNGWKKEYSPEGTQKSAVYYEEDRAVEPPKPAVEPARSQETESLVSGKSIAVARGELFSFNLNGKYIGKVRLDKDFNLITKEGKMPEGAVKIYGRDGKLQKEIIFKQEELKILRLYGTDGAVRAVYTYHEGKATKFALQ